MKVTAPTRITHTYTQHLLAQPADVFPLLCPVLEAEWARDWDPAVVYSRSGFAEEDCVFVTSSEAGDEVWVITEHDRDNWLVEMVMVAPAVLVMRLAIRLRPGESGCLADVSYTKTSLGPGGDAEIARFTEEGWRDFMTTWERELNEYLRKTGAERDEDHAPSL